LNGSIAKLLNGNVNGLFQVKTIAFFNLSGILPDPKRYDFCEKSGFCLVVFVLN